MKLIYLIFNAWHKYLLQIKHFVTKAVVTLDTFNYLYFLIIILFIGDMKRQILMLYFIIF